MKIELNKVVGMDYTLKNKFGQVLDSSADREPLYFIQGIGNIIVGLEAGIEGLSVGDEFNVTVEPEQGYGLYRDDMLLSVPKKELDHIDDLKEGLRLQSESEEGVQTLLVKEIGDDTVTLDANHDLAGMTLFFTGTITDVRDAEKSELEHGHVHGPGGHHH